MGHDSRESRVRRVAARLSLDAGIVASSFTADQLVMLDRHVGPAAAELRARYGHDVNVILDAAGVPVSLSCGRCPSGWEVTPRL